MKIDNCLIAYTKNIRKVRPYKETIGKYKTCMWKCKEYKAIQGNTRQYMHIYIYIYMRDKSKHLLKIRLRS